METITFNCRFITPAFLGGADPRGTPELRPPSIKGALRFWWRAQAGISDIQTLRERESLIFGGVEGQEKAKKANFSIRVQYDDFDLGNQLPRSSIPTNVIAPCIFKGTCVVPLFYFGHEKAIKFSFV